jgi:protein SCO1/2
VIRGLLASSLLAFVVLTGCRTSPTAEPQSSTSDNFKVYKLRGKVVSTDAAKSEVTLNHEAIPGFMEAMTMPYKLKNPSILSELHPGDILTADLDVPQNSDADVLLDRIVIVGQARADYRPAMTYHVPAAGDAVPDFALRNQDGRAIHLAQFRGKALLITFIYTRCPLPDFCPRVTRNFARVESDLAKNGKLLNGTHLICVSFDPEHDTPERLKAYGAEYIGGDGKSAFAHWDFATPQRPVLKEMARFFDVGFSDETDGTITHTLSTTLMGPDGKVVEFYPGNDWTVEQVVADVKKLEGAAS